MKAFDKLQIFLVTALLGSLCFFLIAGTFFRGDLPSNLRKPLLLLQTKALPSHLPLRLKTELELAELELGELALSKNTPKQTTTERLPKGPGSMLIKQGLEKIRQRLNLILQEPAGKSLGKNEKARAYAGRGECKIRLGLNNNSDGDGDGESDLKKASELDPGCAQNIHERAYQALTMEDYEDGEFLETLAIKISPQVKYYFNRAVARYELCRYQEALQDFDAVLAQGEPSKAETRRNLHRYRAQTLEALGRLDEARVAIKKAEKAAWEALQTSPDDLDLFTFYDEGLILARQGDFQALVDRMQEMQKRRKDAVFQTFYLFGMAKLGRLKHKDSLDSLDADELIGVREFLETKLEPVLEALESDKASLKPASNALVLPPGTLARLRLLADLAYFAAQDCNSLADCARVSLQEGDYKRAVEELSKAEDMNGSVNNHVTARLEYLKAQAYEKLGLKREAEKALQTAKDFGYKSPAQINLISP